VRRALADSGAADQSGSDGAADALAKRLAELPAADREQVLVDLVRTEAALALGYPSADAVEPDRAFSDLGFDSLAGIDLRNRLNAATGVPVSVTAVFDYPTPLALAAHLRQTLLPDEAAGLPVLAELDKLESMLTSAPVQDEESDRITARLEAVLERWRDVRQRGDGAAVAERLESSSDDEVFDFLGKEFGIY